MNWNIFIIPLATVVSKSFVKSQYERLNEIGFIHVLAIPTKIFSTYPMLTTLARLARRLSKPVNGVSVNVGMLIVAVKATDAAKSW